MGSDAGFGIVGQGFFNSSDAIVNLCILEPRTFCPPDQVPRTVAVTQFKILRKLRQCRRGVSPTLVGRYIPTARSAPKASVVARIDFVLLRRRRDDRLDAASRLANVPTNVLGCLVIVGKLNHMPQEFVSPVDPILKAIKRWIGGGIQSILDELPVRRRRICSVGTPTLLFSTAVAVCD